MDSLVWLTSNLGAFPTLEYLYKNVAGNTQILRALCVDFSGRVLLYKKQRKRKEKQP